MRFNEKDWLTTDYYGPISEVPNESGVYALVISTFVPKLKKFKHKVAYIGMSLNLSRRLGQHEVIGEINEFLSRTGKSGRSFLRAYFQVHATNLRKIERDLIRAFNPPYNTVGKRRGL